ncbi:MAG: DUF5615 family PIN-like protein [Anaerolineae bacterium]|nr:DUF5615 family PIN-like protein [Anaerolineae bacterium]
MTVLRFYLDENVQVVIAEQLRKRGIEAVTVRDLGTLGAEDITHLMRATEMCYVRMIPIILISLLIGFRTLELFLVNTVIPLETGLTSSN